jgi:glutathione S-transferase
MGLTLYGSGLSPFVRKVRVVLAEKNIPYAIEQISPFRPPPDFESLSPLKRIPVLRDSDWPEGVTLPDSSVICDYLENTHPEPALFPKGPLERARAVV